jgi:hypothetical protein
MKPLYLFLGALMALASAQMAVAGSEVTFFVFARIQDTVQPAERSTKYEEPLDAALKTAKFGEVTGGGSMLSKQKTIEWVGVDIELVNLTDALDFTKKILRQLGAPKGTVLEFTRDAKEVRVPLYDE